MLVPMRPILEAADKYHYGQGAFNMNSVGQIEAAVRIHELLRSGAILQGAEASNAFMGGELDFMHGRWKPSRRVPRTSATPSKNTVPTAPYPLPCTSTTARALRASKPASPAATPPS